MIYKRHLLKFGPDPKTSTEQSDGKEKSIFSMGEDEQWEAIKHNTLTPRTWWRKWQKLQ